MTSNNEPTQPTIRTTLRIVGTFEPDVVTNELGLRPTRTWRKGSLRGGSPVLQYSDDGWALEVSKRVSLHLDEELAEALALLSPRTAQLTKLLREENLRAQLSFGVEVEGGQYPSISFSAAQISAVSQLGVSIDVDIF